ncbi:MAG TPA: extracellular solute-binding protein, partial [Anaerolineales bacterium]
KKKNKVLHFLLVLVGMVLPILATSCGPAPTQAPAVASPQVIKETQIIKETQVIKETVAVLVTPTPAPTAVPAPLKGEISISVVLGAMMDFMQPMAEKFMAANPGTTVNVVEEPQGGAFEALIAAGNQPDIVVGSFGYMPAKYASLDALAPLEDMPGATELFAQLDPVTVQEYYGHKYYVPAGIDITLMIYNKDLFTEAGLDPEKPPVTYQEFLDDAQKISALPPRADGSKVYGTLFWNEALAWGGWYWNMLQPIYLNTNQNACTLLNRIGTDIVFDAPECKMANFLQFAKDAQKYAPPDMTKNFFSRSIGMWLQYGYSWEPNLKTAADKPMVIGQDVGVAPVPVPAAGDSSFTTLGGRPYMIMKTTPERELLAWEFVKFLMTDENSLAFNTTLGYLPVKLSLESDPYFATPERKPFVDLLSKAVFPQAFANFDTVANDLLKVYSQVVVDASMTPEEGVTAAAASARTDLGIVP